jgi:hypothetical protein
MMSDEGFSEGVCYGEYGYVRGKLNRTEAMEAQFQTRGIST